ncbi:hypothetical protein [Hyalangium minutum]|uniref:FHA domain-containing protein n=1 Tax=Hyalangium minutum TaxID=394096 RepID=A0A085WUG6_9BACT|nr:hypothetical protein [Hyalangium minutum]KFE71329.1 hypothetical protein DB31_3459 [Hyalangium minutum]
MSSPGLSPWSLRVARLEPWFTVGLVLAATVGLAYHCRYLAVPIVDDAAISLAYSQTLFAGHGLRITPFSQPVEGFSNPLWTLLLGLSRPLGRDPVSYTHVLGIIFGVLALPAFSYWGPAARGRDLRVEDALGPLVAAMNPTYAYWISSGMETGLEAFLLAISGLFVLKELRTGRSAHAGWALGLLCLTRPEGVLFAGASAVLWVVSRGLERRWPGRQEWRIGAWLVALVGGWLVVRWSLFADLLPNTYYAKSTMDFQVGQYLETFALTYGPLCKLAVVCAVLGLSGGRDEVRRTALTCLFVGCGVFFVWRAKGDWMREWRFIAPLVPLLGVAVATGISGLREWSARIANRGAVWPARTLRLLAVALVLIPGNRVARESLERSPQVKAAPELPYTFIAGLAEQVRATTRQLGQLRPLVAYPDLGGLAMVMRNAEIIDLAGLADYAVARHRLRLGAMEDYLVSEGPPILMDLHGPSGYFVNLQKLMAEFHPIGGSFFMLNGLSATEDPRCPEGKATTLALGLEALIQRFEQEIREDQAPRALKRWRCVTAYKPRKELPDRAARKRLAELADARGDTLLREGKREPALRQYSLATLLDDGNAHRRRKTETLRAQLFPAEPP